MTYVAPAPVTDQEVNEQTRASLALRAWADAFVQWYNAQRAETEDRPMTPVATWRQILAGIERRYRAGDIEAADLAWTVQHELDWSWGRSLTYANQILTGRPHGRRESGNALREAS